MPKTEAEFLEHYRGLPNNILQTACGYAGVGTDYRGCSKPMMAECYARNKHSVSIGLKNTTLAQIDEAIAGIYARGQVSAAQSLKVFNWLRKHNLIEVTQRQKRDHERKTARSR